MKCFKLYLCLIVATYSINLWAAHPCAESELIINNKTLHSLYVTNIASQGKSKLEGLNTKTHIKILERVIAKAYADNGFFVYHHIAAGEVTLATKHDSKQTVVLHYRFYPIHATCSAEGAVTIKGPPTMQVVVHPQPSTDKHRSHLEFLLLPTVKKKIRS